MNRVTVGMGDYQIVRHPAVIETVALGSCVGVILHCRDTRITGLAHIMLPASVKTEARGADALPAGLVQGGAGLGFPQASAAKLKPGKYADTAIKEMLEKMLQAGAKKDKLLAKMAGGASMFTGVGNEWMQIGFKNIAMSKSILKELNIALVAEDCGSNFGRTVEFSTETGKLTIRSAQHGSKDI
ncbi:MAG: hypothetical protein A2X28_08580 [Elusimicrobia bacterium GWA2_56_46]|nr:MAG: hypothetical protein A2X28_08580 [Elusimicrobia bacterium GWA2_56_46]OGR55191.1 MAG: hypothetical protein A2X39_01485 [Elusimicrobia bacterium GWC2_56_31]